MHQAPAHASSALTQGIRRSHNDLIEIGVDHRGMTVEWSYPTVSNFNIIFLGGSGAGKTHTIHHMAAEVHIRGTTFHVVDIKGDFGYENFVATGLGHKLVEGDFHDIVFDYSLEGCALNPLQVPRTKDGGGVIGTIGIVKELVKIFNPHAGVKQLTYLTEILKTVYEKHGIDHDDPETWSKPSPTFVEVLAEIDLIFNALTGGMDTTTVSAIFMAFGTAKKQADSAIKKMTIAEEGELAIEEKVLEICSVLEGNLIGHARNLISYGSLTKKRSSAAAEWEHWSKETLYGLKSIIQEMIYCRLFTGNPSRPKSGKINRYVLTALTSAHQQVIMRIIAAQVFAMGIMETNRSGAFNPEFPSHILVADEGKHIKEISASPLDPFNRIGTEGRGYGVGVWCGVQQPDQVTKDLLKNFATYFLLKTPEASYNEVAKLFGTKPSQLKQLVARENLLFGTGGPYSLVTHFR